LRTVGDNGKDPERESRNRGLSQRVSANLEVFAKRRGRPDTGKKNFTIRKRESRGMKERTSRSGAGLSKIAWDSKKKKKDDAMNKGTVIEKAVFVNRGKK